MKPKQKKLIAAVTGANGLIGQCIVEMLLKKGWVVKALTRSSNFSAAENISVVRGDINDEAALQYLLSGVDAVFHCAAELQDEAKMYDVNVKGTKTLIGVLASSSANYFCYISSAGVVGPTKKRLVTEQTECNPYNEYERSKYEAEKLILSSRFKGRTCILRPTNVISSAKKGILVLPLRDGWKEKLMCFLKGKEGAHLVHVKDVAAAAVFFINKPLLKPEVYLVSRDEEHQNTLLGVYALVMEHLGKKRKCCFLCLPVIIPFGLRCLFKGNSLHGDSRFSSEKIRKTGFSFPLSFENAILEVCE